MDGAGSRVHAEWTHTSVSRARDQVLLSLIHHFPINRMIPRLWVSTLNRYAQSDLAELAGSHRATQPPRESASDT